MLIAYDIEKKRHKATPEGKGTKYLCPDCEQPVFPKTGTEVIWHFAHYPYSNIPCENQGESILHQECKDFACKLFNGERDDLIEVDFKKEIGRRADVLVEGSTRFVIEIQTSSISIEEILERTKGYNKIGLPVLWLIGHRNYEFPMSLKEHLNTVWGFVFYISPENKSIRCEHESIPNIDIIDTSNPIVVECRPTHPEGAYQLISFRDVEERMNLAKVEKEYVKYLQHEQEEIDRIEADKWQAEYLQQKRHAEIIRQERIELEKEKLQKIIKEGGTCKYCGLNLIGPHGLLHTCWTKYCIEDLKRDCKDCLNKCQNHPVYV